MIWLPKCLSRSDNPTLPLQQNWSSPHSVFCEHPNRVIASLRENICCCPITSYLLIALLLSWVCYHIDALLSYVLWDMSWGFWKVLYVHQPFLLLFCCIYPLFWCSISWWSCFPSCAAWSFYFVPSCSCHKIWWALSISLSPRRPSNSLWLIVLVFDKSCWPSSNKASWRILHLCFSGCFELLSNLSPSSQKPRACNEEQKSMTPWDTHL